MILKNRLCQIFTVSLAVNKQILLWAKIPFAFQWQHEKQLDGFFCRHRVGFNITMSLKKYTEEQDNPAGDKI